MAEVIHGFSTYGAYVRTYRNILPDDITREDWQAALGDLKAQGWEEVSVGDAWRHFMTELERQFEANLGALVPFGAPEDDVRLARQLAECRGRRSIPPTLTPDNAPVVVELFAAR